MVPGAILARGRDVCKRNGLLILSVLSVTVGCLLGFFLRTRRLSPQVSHPELLGGAPWRRGMWALGIWESRSRSMAHG